MKKIAIHSLANEKKGKRFENIPFSQTTFPSIPVTFPSHFKVFCLKHSRVFYVSFFKDEKKKQLGQFATLGQSSCYLLQGSALAFGSENSDGGSIKGEISNEATTTRDLLSKKLTDCILTTYCVWQDSYIH